ncbi:DNA cytosine methyltransferase [Rhodococcus sp. ABRD24]|uniref:DNA cytosine methyltransferase n=1 Tax=Rhodococcus sp. ABRD24 TaxID=2507582 RepID=UPI001040683B|nr:DNA cytosine methyltransferase [Rhodococcus sp. ABRD24]QBJ97889.1 DNA cytosine methyltransferase [Rhodococcus sp. ABRD24]
MSRTSAFRTLDLFAGAGGLSAGLHAADERFRPVTAVEMDVAAAATYATNFDAHVYAGKIEDWLAHEDVPEVDVVVGGPPCQGFSSLGRQDAADTRNKLWSQYAEAVRLATPRYFIMENVPQFMKSPEFELFRQSTKRDGRLQNYTFDVAVLNSAHFGAAQARKRTIIFGWHRDLKSPELPKDTHSENPVTVRAALAGIAHTVHETQLPDSFIEFNGKQLPGAFKSMDLHLSRRYEKVSLDRFKEIPSGGNRFNLPDHLLAECWRNHKTGSADVMGRMHWDRPSVTIRTEFFKPEKGRYLHPSEDRAITHYEATRLQGFPEDYQWVGSKTSIAKQIGNAVPIPLGRAIGRTISRALSED